MQNNTDNNEHDIFSESIRQKLENHSLPVDPKSWDQINERLNSKKRKSIPFWFWLSGGAAVAVIALLFTLRPLAESGNTIAKSTNANIQHSNGQRVSITTNQQPKAHQSTKSPVKQALVKTPKSEHIRSTVASNFPPSRVVLNDSIEKINANQDVQDNNNLKKKDELTQYSTNNKDSVSKNRRQTIDILVEKTSIEPIVSKKNRNSWLLAASYGTNGSLPTGNRQGDFLSYVDNKNIVSAETNYTSIMTPTDFSDITYTPPLSIGLVIRKNLNKEWSLESGLVYTYLMTTFENSGMQRNNARLHLHYIGIPLNLVAQLWNNTKWEIYLSGGGMIEKGIRSVYVQNLYSGNQTITTTANTNISGVQWSVNGAIGTTYKIQPKIGLFFEPKISYFFDNHQPLSARTEFPVVIGLSAGVRFQFK